ncbi:MAG: hypothetical protein E6Q97_23075 [Desulfurellales bacterium]|nr:MAG: hypothetical protein E6Q97_23075 [Desulfurellales bacterium]
MTFLMTATVKEESGHQTTLRDVQEIHYTRNAEDGPEINFVVKGINHIFAFTPMTNITITPQAEEKEEAICWDAEKLS